MNKIITISREFGSGGREIGRRLAEAMKIAYYDQEIVAALIKRTKKAEEYVHYMEKERPLPLLPITTARTFGLPTNYAVTENLNFYMQESKIIQEVAEKSDCVIVGRCSDYILRNMENAMHIYIYAPYADRLDNCINELMMSEEEAKKSIAEIDKARDSYHLNYAGYLPSKPETKDILISSSLYGYKGTAEFLVNAIKRRFEL